MSIFEALPKARPLDPLYFDRKRSLESALCATGSAQPAGMCVDVGANVGQTLETFLQWWPESKCVSFEPLPAAQEALARIVQSSKGRAISHEIALSDVSTTADFYAFADQSTYSSLRPLNRKASTAAAHRGLRDSPSVLEKRSSDEDYTIPVRVTTLDSHFANVTGRELEWTVGGVDVLKIDTQGTALRVLRGARNTLRKTRVVLFEWQFDDVYGAPESLADVDALLNESGLRLWDIAHIYKDLTNLRTLWVDLVYARTVV